MHIFVPRPGNNHFICRGNNKNFKIFIFQVNWKYFFSPKCANETSTASLASESEVFAAVAPSFVVKDATPVCSFGSSSTVSKILSSNGATPRRISVPFNNDSINVTPCRGPANRSACDDLWTDEESFNDTFIKATQKIMDEYEHEYTSPESKKRKEFVSSTPEVPFKGSGRFTFTLDSVKPITTHKPFSLKSADSSAASSCQAVKVIGNDVARSAAILDTSLPDELFAAILDTDQSIRSGDAVKNSKQPHTIPGKNCMNSNDPKFSAPAPIHKQGCSLILLFWNLKKL